MVVQKQCTSPEVNQRPNMAGSAVESTPRKLVLPKPSVYDVCRCCNDNVFEKKHPIDLYGPKATKESILLLLERLTGFKCDIADGMSSKVCRPCYDKILKFKKFCEMFERSTAQQQSLIRFKRGKGESDSPSLKSTGHARKKLAESENICASESGSRARSSVRVFLFSSTPRPILPAPSVSGPKPLDGEVTKRRVLPRGIFPQPPKPKSKPVEILSQSGLHNPSVRQIPLKLSL